MPTEELYRLALASRLHTRDGTPMDDLLSLDFINLFARVVLPGSGTLPPLPSGPGHSPSYSPYSSRAATSVVHAGDHDLGTSASLTDRPGTRATEGGSLPAALATLAAGQPPRSPARLAKRFRPGLALTKVLGHVRRLDSEQMTQVPPTAPPPPATQHIPTHRSIPPPTPGWPCHAGHGHTIHAPWTQVGTATRGGRERHAAPPGAAHQQR